MSPYPTIEKIRNENSTVQFLDDIFFVIYDREIVITVEDFEETLGVYKELSEGRKLKVLVEFSPFVTATAEARKWAEDNQVACIAEAIIFHSLAQRMLIRFYLIFRKQAHPVKIFPNKQLALKWLDRFPG